MILDWIKNLLFSNKKNAQLYVKNLTKTYGDSDQLEIGLYDGNVPLPNKKIGININNVDYYRTTDSDGIARININLQPNKYKAYVSFSDDEYKYVNAYADIIVNPKSMKTHMEGTNINMTYKDGTKYQCAVYDENNNRVKETVTITINGVPYTKEADSEGLYKLNINLNPGTYSIKAEYKGSKFYEPSVVNNTIVIKNKPVEVKPVETVKSVECQNPYESSPHPTGSGCNGMGQNTSTYCAPSSVHKCLYKFGIRDISQGQLASWMGTGSAGTSHAGIETGIAKVNKVKGTNISIAWYNLSDLGWEKIGKLLCQPNKAVFCHVLYKNGGTCNGSGNYGHYELLTKVNTATKYVKVLNSLGGKCGSCYCGFYQDRTMACQEQFIKGISQKSIAVLTKN